MTVTSRSNPYKTSDMTEAAFLSLRGFGYALVREGTDGRGRDLAAWEFSPHEELPYAVAEFAEGESRVEPTRFQRKLNAIRNELYDFLGINTRRKNRTS